MHSWTRLSGRWRRKISWIARICQRTQQAGHRRFLFLHVERRPCPRILASCGCCNLAGSQWYQCGRWTYRTHWCTSAYFQWSLSAVHSWTLRFCEEMWILFTAQSSEGCPGRREVGNNPSCWTSWAFWHLLSLPPRSCGDLQPWSEARFSLNSHAASSYPSMSQSAWGWCPSRFYRLLSLWDRSRRDGEKHPWEHSPSRRAWLGFGLPCVQSRYHRYVPVCCRHAPKRAGNTSSGCVWRLRSLLRSLSWWWTFGPMKRRRNFHFCLMILLL